MTTFTDTQKLACDISRNIAVTAGAGSGKTSVLVERYLWCLQNNGYQVRRIVAITFTEKAAGEMLGRIRERITAYSSGELGDPGRWEDVLDDISLANISTIHSFCQRLLREFPIEAGVDPDFDVFDETSARLCLTQLIDDIIQQRAETYNGGMTVLAELWTPYTLRNVLLHLLAFRTTSLPWARRIQQEDFPTCLAQLHTLAHDVRRRGIRQIATNNQWQETITLIRSLIPEGDSSKLTSRCLNILDYDHEFRHLDNEEQQLLTLKMLNKECRMITPSAKWKADDRNVRLKEAFQQLKAWYDTALPPFEIHEALEQSGFQLQQALADLLLAVDKAYRQEKTDRRVLDFDDLQEYARLLLENASVHGILAQRYDYIMVDEFQDTNQLQWDIIHRLGTPETGPAPHAFCIVGDEKQSIYMFRGAKVAVFGQVRQALQEINRAHQLTDVSPQLPPLGDIPQIGEAQKTGELIMAENFRSEPALLYFFNYLFSRLLLPTIDPDRPFEVQHQELLPGRHRSSESKEPETSQETEPPAPVEFLIVHQPDEEHSDSPLPLEEPELVARRVQELAESRPYRDIAILLRTRTRLKAFEEALRRHGIPFVVAGGIGFYQQQEIYDLANLLHVLVDQRQDIALAGVLRSPLFNFSDDQLLYVSNYESSKKEKSPLTPLYQKGELHRETFLWEKLAAHVRLAEAIPPEIEPSKFLHASQMLHTWKAQVDRIPITHLLRRILDDTGFYGILAASHRDVQSLINIEKLLDIARTFESEGFRTVHDFVIYLEQLIELEEREGEAQIDIEGMNAVRVMTIHAAKGLEFPVVVLPELDRAFNYGSRDPVYLDTIVWGEGKLPVIGIKGLHPDHNYEPEDTVLRTYLKRLNEEKTDAEMKRLLYVACTRAKQHLILSGALSDNVSRHSWMFWLLNLLPLEAAISEQGFVLSDEHTQPRDVGMLHVPVRTSQHYTSSEAGKPEKPSPEHLAQSVIAWFSDERRMNAENETSTAIYNALRAHFTSLSGHEIFQISPSTVHTLLQCPRRYYYQHILKFRELNPPDETPLTEGQSVSALRDDAEAPRSFATDRGTIIHRLFEKQVFDANLSQQELLRISAAELDHSRIPEAVRQQMRIHEAVIQAYQHYQQSGLRELLVRSPELYREYPFYLRIDSIDISGTLDVLFFDPEREIWTILDYKSNEIASEQIPDEVTRHGYDIQMQLYALAVSRLLNVKRIRSLLFFTFPGVLYDSIDLSPEPLEKLTATISDFFHHLREGSLDLACNPAACEDCGYKGYDVCHYKDCT